MKPEYEARFLDIDPRKITASLTALGGHKVMARTLMRRIVFVNDDLDARGGMGLGPTANSPASCRRVRQD